MTVPEGWKQLKLGDLAEKTPSSFVDGPFGSNLKVSDYSDYGVPLIQLQNIGEGYFLFDNKKFIPPQKADDLYRHQANPGDVIIAKMAEPVARSCIVPNINEKWIIVADCMRLKPDRSIADNEFIMYAINSRYMRIQAIARSTGSTRKRINLSEMRKLDILLPPLPEQKKIAEILGSVDEAIQTTQETIEQTKRVKKGLLQDLLTKGIGHTRFKKTEIGEIPEEWEVVQICDLLESCVYGTSKALNTDGKGIPVLRMGNIIDNRLDLSDLKHVVLSEKEIVRLKLLEGDILFNRTNSIDQVGKVALVTSNIPIVYAGYILRLRVNDLANSHWLYFLLASGRMQNKLRSIATLGVSQVNINPTVMKSLFVAYPPLQEQAEIALTLNSIDKQVQSERKKLEVLEHVKTGLKQDLLTGEVRVNYL